MNVNGIVSKLTSNADKLGLLYGFLQDPMYGSRGLSGAPDFIIDRLQHWKPSTFGKPQFLLDFYMGNQPYIGTAKTAAMLYILGEAAGMVGQGKWGNVMKKFAVGAFKGSIVALAAFAPALNPHGTAGGGSGGSSGRSGYGY